MVKPMEMCTWTRTNIIHLDVDSLMLYKVDKCRRTERSLCHVMLIVTDTNSPWYNTYGVVLVWCMVLILLIKDLTLNSQVF